MRLMQRSAVVVVFSSFSFTDFAQTSPPDAQARRRLWEKKCAACHGAAQVSGLDIRRQDTLLKGGKRGPAINPGHAEQSLLYQAAAHKGELKMPPGSKTPLAAEEL